MYLSFALFKFTLYTFRLFSLSFVISWSKFCPHISSVRLRFLSCPSRSDIFPRLQTVLRHKKSLCGFLFIFLQGSFLLSSFFTLENIFSFFSELLGHSFSSVYYFFNGFCCFKVEPLIDLLLNSFVVFLFKERIPSNSSCPAPPSRSDSIRARVPRKNKVNLVSEGGR